MLQILKYILPILFSIMMSNCTNDTGIKYNYNKKDDYYSLIYTKLKCQGASEAPCAINLTLNKDNSKIESVYTVCMQHRSLEESLDDIKNVIDHFKLEKQFKNTSIMKVSFMQGWAHFPNFIKYLNEQKKSIVEELNTLSMNREKPKLDYFIQLEKLIVKSGIYDKAIETFNYKGCRLKLDFSNWHRKKGFENMDFEATGRYTVERYGVLREDEINFESYPHPENLPLRIKCQ